MKKLTLVLLLLSFFTFSCKSDDSQSSNNLVLKNYIEPIIDFTLTETQLISLIGEKDSSHGNNTTLGFINVYNSDGIDGEFKRNYEFNFTSTTQTEAHLTDIEIVFSSSTDNYNFILNWLENKYGVSEFTSAQENRNKWNDLDFRLTLYSNENVLRLVYSEPF